MSFSPSPQQQDFYNWVQNCYGSCVLEAVAGAGKTTTLVNGVSMMEGFVFFGAFNKKIAEEIKGKVAHLGLPKLTVNTMHAEGFKIWRRVAKEVKVDSNKCRNIVRDGVERMKGEGNIDDAEKIAQFESQILKLVSLAKQSGCGLTWTDRREWFNLIEHFDVDCVDEEEFVVKAAIGVLKKSISMDREVVDFDDMIYAPLIHQCNPFKYDWVLIDEAQDTNATRRLLALSILKKGGRLIAVGDRHQAIYGFTGADANALDLIAREVNAVRLPLTVTYRCPKAVVKHAHRWVTHIQAHETAPEGVVTTLPMDKKLSEVAKPGDAILCRFNAPLLSLVYGFIAEGIPAKIEGREIGSGLKALASRWKVRSFDAMVNKLEKFKEKEVLKYTEKEQPSKVQAVEDKVECLMVIIERCRKKADATGSVVDQVCAEIDGIFSDDVSAKFVVLSTIHKSKGREWPNVFWLQTGPSKWAKQQWEMEQENNLCYVATTRAQECLTLVNAPTNESKTERKVEETEAVAEEVKAESQEDQG